MTNRGVASGSRIIGMAVVMAMALPAVAKDSSEPKVLSDAAGVNVTPGRANDVDIVTTSTFAIAPVETVSVRDEKSTLPATLPHMWMGGNLRQVRTANAISGSLIPQSVVVKLEDGTVLEREKDYVLDETWASIARTPHGRISTDTVVLASYDYSLMRLDAIDINVDGRVTLSKGTAHLVCPKPPELTSGTKRLAHVFMPYTAKSVEPWQIYELGEPFPEPSHAEQVEMSQPVRKTLQKLSNGENVTIVTWGDSVTVGGDSSKPELAYANLFVSRLKERFPKAKITHINAGIGGTTTNDRLPGFEKDVLAHKPDLVTIEFVNDMGLPIKKLRENWNSALKKIKDAGAEAVVITPHFTSSFIAMHPHPRGGENRPNVLEMRKLAKDNGVALADTAQRWEHLEAEGLPYVTLLYNGINHPDDRGHELFVKDLMNLFPAED